MADHEIAASDLKPGDCYRLMTSIVAPRPIAWVSTQSAAGARNLAPFSYFQAISSNPPTVVLGIAWRAAAGRPKDTLANILETGEFTVNHVSEGFAEAMNTTAADLEPEESEWDRIDAEPEPSVVVTPPRVKGVNAAMECRLTHAMPIGRLASGNGPSSMLVVGEVVHFHVREGALRWAEDGRLRSIDPAELSAVGRLGGMGYTTTQGLFELERPKR